MYLAFDNDTGREVAWNVISFAHLNRSERKRIDAEIQMIKSLNHPRILQFISVWMSREREEVVFITERVSGGSLRSYICRLDGPLKLKVIKNWCRQILEGIAYLHSQPNPVIHRDLKCDNIFINGNDGKVLIGDLGLSTSLRGQASCATSIVGTPEFMAPELYEEKYGPPVDLYAFGMCLVEMVSRQYPYSECTTPGQIYKKVIASEKPQVLSRVKDATLRHIIEVCLDTNPENRPTAQDLLADPYWSQIDVDGDRLAEIIEEDVGAQEGANASNKKLIAGTTKSGAYHEEAEMRKAQAAAAALAPNVVVGPGDDTLILLSSPKSSRRTEELVHSDVLTYCRRKGIERVEKVHLILELNEGKYHNVIFDFNALTDHPQIISQELRDAGLVWEGVSNEELVRLTAQAIMDRISELAVSSSTNSSVVGAPANLNLDLLTGESPDGPVSDSLTVVQVQAPQTLAAAPTKPPLAPHPLKRNSYQALDGLISSGGGSSVGSSQEFSSAAHNSGLESSHYLLLSRETCAHLTVPLAQTLPSGDYPQPMTRMSFESSCVSSATPPEFSSLGARTSSISNSLDEMSLGHPPYSLSNWPSAIPPSAAKSLVSGEDVKQLQAMLAVVVNYGERRHTSFVPGIYCAFTEDTVRDFQLHNGLEITGEVDDKTWEILSEQVIYRKRKEEDRAHKREEAHRKAKLEQERKLQMQKEESARAMDNMMEKTLNSIGGVSSKPVLSPTSNAVFSPPEA